MRKRQTRWGWAFGMLAILGMPGLSAEETTITSSDGFIQVETDDGVSVNWRAEGDLVITDTDQLLVELGGARNDDHIRLAMQGDILFDFGETAIRPDAARKLAQIAQLIRNEAVGEVIVVGHTDSKGDDQSNQTLSERRATAVIEWLVNRENIPARILLARGMGERQPVAPNARSDGSDNPAGRARNRRVDLFISTKAEADLRDMVIRIDGDNVDVGGIAQVDEDGNVQVGDVSIASDGSVSTGSLGVATSSGAVSCAAGRTCNEDCADGDCNMVCPAGAICNYGCRGGNCKMTCAAGGRCEFTCKGGNCEFQCATGATCRTSCSGDDCIGG